LSGKPGRADGAIAPVTAKLAARQLADVGRRFYARGWVLGTSGNFSAVTSRAPLRLAITASSVHKGALGPRDFLDIDDRATVRGRSGNRPSAETRLHLEIVRLRGAGAVLHTHSVWSTILSERHAPDGGLAIDGYEMLKGLAGVTTHAHREWVPIVDNDQDMTRLAGVVARALNASPAAHAFLLRRHGLYTWGATIQDAERHVEILEFLLETMGREGDTTRRDRKGPSHGDGEHPR
jgi:methylthioribulose-1-phosphate dehydratase